jgi:hypothetical protein
MKKWEYKIIFTNPKYRADLAFENQLKKFGSDGWELVGVQENALYFKRPIEEEIPIYSTVNGETAQIR